MKAMDFVRWTSCLVAREEQPPHGPSAFCNTCGVRAYDDILLNQG